MEGQKIADELENILGDQKEEDKFIGGVFRMHRTNQQRLFKVICKMIQAWARADHDLRNEFTVEQCRYLLKTLEEQGVVISGLVSVPYS